MSYGGMMWFLYGICPSTKLRIWKASYGDLSLTLIGNEGCVSVWAARNGKIVSQTIMEAK